MNIKYISLLSLFCAVAANAEELSVAERLERAKKEFNECRKAQHARESESQCQSQRTEFNSALLVFVAPHRQKTPSSNETTNLTHKIRKLEMKTSWPWQRRKLVKEYAREDLTFMGHIAIIKAFTADFLLDDRPIAEFSQHVLDKELKDCPDCDVAHVKAEIMKLVHTQQARKPE